MGPTGGSEPPQTNLYAERWLSAATRDPLNNPVQVASALPLICGNLSELAGPGDAALGRVLFYKF